MSLGSGTRDDSFVYEPALVEVGTTRVGETLRLGLLLPPGSFHEVVLGGSIPGVAAPVPPLEGALEILAPLIGLALLALLPVAYKRFKKRRGD